MYFERTRQLLREGSVRSRYRVRDRQGNYHWLLDEAKLLRDDLGLPVEAVGLWLDVTEATLAASDFTLANVTGANFDQANLEDARFNGVDLSQVLNLSPEQVESTEIDRATQFPPYLEVTWEGTDNFTVKKVIVKKTKRKKVKK